MRRWFIRLIDKTLLNSPALPYWESTRIRLFAAVLWLSLAGMVLVLILANNFAAFQAGPFLIEFALLTWVAIALDLLRRDRVRAALTLYAWGLPLLFAIRYFVVLTTEGTHLDPHFSDYYLVFCLLNLVLQTLVNPSTKPLWIGLFVSLSSELIGALGVLLPANPGRIAEVVSALTRFALIGGLLAGLLMYLQNVFSRTTSLHHQSQQELESQVNQRTAALVESQERLERASASLSEGEKLASLGRLVAGIAHEMNTPLGAIQASSRHLLEHTSRILTNWTNLVPQLGSDQSRVLLALVEQAETNVNLLDSRRIREQRKEISRKLLSHGVPEAEVKGRTLAELGIRDFHESWLPLLLNPGSGVLLQGVTDLVEWKRAVSIIQLSTAKVADQVNGLRRFSTNRKSGRPAVAIDLSQNIETVLLVYRSQFPKTIKISREFPSRGPWVMGNPDTLMQVWSNLIMNAVQALGNSGKLTLEARSGRQWAHVKVTDNGPGIPPEIQQKVLEPFFSTKSNGEGMGLGLQIVATIVGEHGGDLSFESEPGRTMFCVRLPIGEDPKSSP